MDLGLVQGTDEWKQERFKGISGRDVGVILGLEKSCTPLKLYRCKRDKKDQTENASDYAKNLMHLGSQMEDTVAAVYHGWRLRSGLTDPGVRPNLLRDREVPYLIGSPDCLYPESKLVVEYKCHFHPSIAEAEPMRTPEELKLIYYLQVQTYLRITDCEKAHLISWTMCNGYVIFEILRDKFFWDHYIQPRIASFNAIIQSDDSEKQKESVLRMPSWKREENTAAVYESLLTNTHVIEESSPQLLL